MNRNHAYTLLLLLPLLAGCPSSGNPDPADANNISTALSAAPQSVIVREGQDTFDAESVTWRKGFEGALSTSFEEVTTEVAIDVTATAAGECPAASASCEDWTFRAGASAPGDYEVEAFRDISQPDGTIDRASSDVAVKVVPAEVGSARLTRIVDSFDSSVFDAEGQLLSILDRTVFADFQAPWLDDYTPVFLRRSDVDGLGPISLAAPPPLVGPRTFILEDGSAVALRIGGDPRVQPFVALNALLDSADGATPVQLETGLSRQDTGASSLNALRLSDGRVIAWASSDSASDGVFPVDPVFVSGVDDAIDVSISRFYVLILRANGTVLELGRIRAGDDGIITQPQAVSGLTNIVAITGRAALASDGRVFYIPRVTTETGDSQAVPIPNLNDATALGDGFMVWARRSDGSTASWLVDDTEQAGSAFPVTFPVIGNPVAIDRDAAIGGQCGRLWATSFREDVDRLSRALDDTSLVRVTRATPVFGSGGNQRCEAGSRSRIVYFFLAGGGSGTVTAPTGSVDCNANGDVCWWFGPNDGQPQFTAVPDSNSSFRDWRWDCAATTEVSGAVIQAEGTSQNVCKVTFTANGDGATPIENRRLEVRVEGSGSVTADPEAMQFEGAVALYADDTAVTLSAAPDSGFVFAGWDENGCTNDLENDVITVTMDTDRLCIANFSQVIGGVPPVGRIQVTPSTVVTAGTELTFDGSTSSDADGTIVSWDWDFGNDGSIDASGETVMSAFTAPGITDVGLTVTDNDGLVGNAAVGITVQAPAGGTTFTVRVVITGPGQVDVSPIGRTLPDAECDGTECFLFDIDSGTALTFNAAPFTPAAFDGWNTMECDMIPNADTCVVTVTSDRDVNAGFN
ncbi:MAG: PKD domain-containing protein [Pseudomonadota bacterium]